MDDDSYGCIFPADIGILLDIRCAELSFLHDDAAGVRRTLSRLPQIFVIDGGREFESTYFETLLARYECTKKTRPPAKARFGSVCERLFGVANTQFVHNLRGNTQITRNVRQVTKSVNPKSWRYGRITELHQRLSQYLYEVRDTLAHPALGGSPRQAFEDNMTRCGQRLHRVVPYNQEFLMLTLPTTAKGTAKLMPGRGVKINRIYYWCEAFRNFAGERQAIPVRYDPFDVGMLMPSQTNSGCSATPNIMRC